MNLVRIYKTSNCIIVQHEDRFYATGSSWNEFVNRKGLYAAVVADIAGMEELDQHTAGQTIASGLLAPIGTQEVWAAGVTYFRSRTARMEESEDAGGATFYDKVYVAERPELFFKATPQRVWPPAGSVHPAGFEVGRAGTGTDAVRIRIRHHRRLYDRQRHELPQYRRGNPLYLPQAKVYEKCAGLGPCLLVTETPIPPDTMIHMSIYRDGVIQYNDSIAISQMKRGHAELVGFLFRDAPSRTAASS